MEEEIGKTAGAIWDALNTRGEQSLGELKKAVKGKEPTFDWSIGGWRAKTKLRSRPRSALSESA
jgi:Winged helix-turn-helix domain (DUF2582)